jgi:hypothetical protein
MALEALAEPAGVVTTVPLAGLEEASRAFLEQTRKARKGYVVDLTTGHEGTVLDSTSQDELPPGRYRLHVLVGSSPHGNIIVDPVEVRLRAGEASGEFGRPHFAAPGQLSPIWLDFVARQQGRSPIRIDWFVGNSGLDRNIRDIGEARRKFLAQRDFEALKAKESQADIGSTTGGSAEGSDGEPDDIDLTDRQVQRDGLVELASKSLPKHRLMVAGLHLERLCPVAVKDVRPDRVAYGAGEQGKLTIVLENFSASDAEVAVSTEIRDESSGKTVGLASPPVTVTVPGRQTVQHAMERPFSTEGVDWLARVNASAAWKNTRPASGEGMFVIEPPKKPVVERPKKAFAHYMGCWPAGTAAILWQRRTECQTLKHESKDPAVSRGGHVRNFDLVPPDLELTLEQSADLEVRRALRIGLDGFAVDAWAGDQGAKAALDALFKVAEQKDYPFELTVCIDPMCGGNIVQTVKELVQKHGKSPKLARRDGKPLIFGYSSVWPSLGYLLGKFPERGHQFRATPIGWHVMGHAYRDAAAQVGTPIYYQYCMSWFFLNVDGRLLAEDSLTQAVGVLAQYVDAIGGFSWLGPQEPPMAKAVIAAGAEWSDAIGMYQKENIPFESYMPKGTDWVHGNWESLRTLKATLLQFITWNDYGENTNIAPAYNTRYALYDLTGYHIQWWKTGEEPKPDHDRVYLTYAKYPKGAKVFPFKVGSQADRSLEVITILPRPATVRLPGRNVAYDAPAGFHLRQFPLAPGPVVAELVRDGKVDQRLESPEPITDRPFREDNAMVCYSTEFERHWKADFGDRKPWHYSEYGDLDGDGLPNWFEMYWFSKERGFKPERISTEDEIAGEEVKPLYGKWLDLSTATVAEPGADPDGDGKTNLEEYLAQTDPTTGAPKLDAGSDPNRPESGKGE